MEKARVVFMGTPVFGRAILQELIDESLNVVAVVTQPDKLVGRKQVLTYSPVKELALEHNIPVIQPNKIRNEYEEVLSYNPDIIITCAYGQIVPDVVLNAPCLGCINVHASLLPALRGGAPIQHAIIDGYEETGITIMEMASKMDAGDIISQAICKIEEEDTYGSLHDKLIEVAVKLLRDTMPSLLAHNYTPIVQAEDKVTFGYNISKEEERVDLSKSYQAVYNQIRGLIPTPCSYIIVDGKKYKLWEVRKSEIEADLGNGTIVFVGKGLGIVIDKRVLEIIQIQPEGKTVMSAKAFRNGVGSKWEGKVAEWIRKK